MALLDDTQELITAAAFISSLSRNLHTNGSEIRLPQIQIRRMLPLEATTRRCCCGGSITRARWAAVYSRPAVTAYFGSINLRRNEPSAKGKSRFQWVRFVRYSAARYWAIEDNLDFFRPVSCRNYPRLTRYEAAQNSTSAILATSASTSKSDRSSALRMMDV
jgi:hypothetical protein